MVAELRFLIIKTLR